MLYRWVREKEMLHAFGTCIYNDIGKQVPG